MRVLREGVDSFRDLETGEELTRRELRRRVLAGDDLTALGEDGDDVTLDALAEILLPGFGEQDDESGLPGVGALGRLFREGRDRLRDIEERLGSSEESPGSDAVDLASTPRPPRRFPTGPTSRGETSLEVVRHEGSGTVYKTDIRVIAPIDVVWEQVARLDRVLDVIPGVTARPRDTEGSGPPTSYEGYWEVGLWSLTRQRIPIVAAVRAVRPPYEFSFSATSERYGLRVEGAFRLAPLGAEDTDLIYEVSFATVPERLNRRTLRTLEDLLEAHAQLVVGRVAQRAEQMYAARLNLSPDVEPSR